MTVVESLPRSRVKALLEHFALIKDARDPWRVAHPLNEVLLLVVLAKSGDYALRPQDGGVIDSRPDI